MLELKNISRTYTPKKGVPVQALKEVNLSFEDRGMVFVLGKSGSGKSTLLNLIGGLDFADSGEIIIDGKSSKDFKQADYDSYRNTYIGFVFQEYNILNEFTVGENISLALELQSQKGDKQRLDEILKEVDLEGYADRKPNELSGGQKQRVAIARAIIKNPKIIMADEPTGALDSETGKSIFDTLKRLSQDRLVIVVSHDRDFAEQYGDRIIELADGEVISDERKNAQEIVNNENKENTQKAELKKSKLPYKRALAMGAKSLRRKRFRLAITIILCFFSFTAFGFADVLVSFDIQKAVTTSFYKGSDDYASFNTYISDGTDAHARGKVQAVEGTFSSLNDLQKIKESTGLDFQGVVGGYSRLPLYNEYKLQKRDSKIEYYQAVGGAFLPASQQLFDTMDFKLYGRLPNNENEIVITKYLYDQFVLAGVDGLTSDEDILPQEIKSIQDFLDRNIDLRMFHDVQYSLVVGIVDTNADVDGALRNCNPSDPYVLNWSLRKYFKYGYHSLTFVYPSLYDRYLEENAHEDTKGFGRNVEVSISGIGAKGVATQDVLKNVEKVTWLDGKGDRKELAENEILIGIARAPSLWPGPDESSIYAIMADRKIPCGYNRNLFDNLITFRYMSQYDIRNEGKYLIAYCEEAEKLPNDKLEIYKQYCKDNDYIFSDWDLHGKVDIGAVFIKSSDDFYSNSEFDSLDERKWRFSYACYLAIDEKYGAAGGYNSNVTGEPSGSQVAKENGNRVYVENRIAYSLGTMKQINSKEYSIWYSGMNSRGENSGNEFVGEPKIVGIYYPKEGYPADFFINDVLYDNSLVYEDTTYTFMIAPLAGGKKTKDVAKMITSLQYDTSEARNFYCNNAVYYESDYMSGSYDVFRYIFYIGSAVLGIFSILLLGTYIEQSISSKKKEIGILRAVGAKKSDVFAIFINELVVIASIILVLASIGAGFMTLGFNLLTPKIIGMSTSFKWLSFGIRQIAVLLAVIMGTTAIASAIPLYKLSKKKPVDCIQDR